MLAEYDVIRHDGGYRVALGTRGDLFDLKLSPWFRNKGLAVSWRNGDIRRKIREMESDDTYPKSVTREAVEEYKALLGKKF